MIKKIALILAAVAFIFGIIYAISCIPRPVSLEYDGVQYRRSAPGEWEPANIRIDGKMTYKLFKAPEFQGLMEISTLEDTINNPGTGHFNSFDNLYTSFIYYIRPWHKPGESAFYTAPLFTDPPFSYLVYNLFEYTDANSSATRDLVIVAPANTVEEAERLIAKHGLSISDGTIP